VTVAVAGRILSIDDEETPAAQLTPFAAEQFSGIVERPT
jgi:hypothetical protein